MKINIYDLNFNELSDLLKSWKVPGYRVKQVWEWLYQHKVDSFDAMTNLPASLRERLDTEARIGIMEIAAEKRARDGTIKRLYRLDDGALIESVLMLYDDNRRTACISSQAGCAMGCVFCATGQMGFGRHLTTGEIVEQAIHFARILESEDERLSNIVLMGMGEPLHNYDPTLEAVRRFIDADTMGIGQRHITISTVGLVPAIRKFADEKLQVKLAISLHAATDEERDALLPVNKRWNLDTLMDACRYYIRQTNRQLTFEWALINGENDTVEQATRLGNLLEGMLCHVNLIPLNPTGGYEGQPSDPDRVDDFIHTLAKFGVSSSVRVRRGIEINAGCGQLKAEVIASNDIPVISD